MKTLLQKLNTAKAKIAEMKPTKDGKNSFSNYDYYTPELVQKMVNKGTEDLGLYIGFSTERDEHGEIIARLRIIDIETGEELIEKMVTDVPEIKATNVTQRFGGMMTYTKRYLLMSTFDITDNTLDFDAAIDKRKDLNLATYDKIMKSLKDKEAPTFEEWKKANYIHYDKGLFTRKAEGLKDLDQLIKIYDKEILNL